MSKQNKSPNWRDPIKVELNRCKYKKEVWQKRIKFIQDRYLISGLIGGVFIFIIGVTVLIVWITNQYDIRIEEKELRNRELEIFNLMNVNINRFEKDLDDLDQLVNISVNQLFDENDESLIVARNAVERVKVLTKEISALKSIASQSENGILLRDSLIRNYENQIELYNKTATKKAELSKEVFDQLNSLFFYKINPSNPENLTYEINEERQKIERNIFDTHKLDEDLVGIQSQLDEITKEKSHPKNLFLVIIDILFIILYIGYLTFCDCKILYYSCRFNKIKAQLDHRQ